MGRLLQAFAAAAMIVTAQSAVAGPVFQFTSTPNAGVQLDSSFGYSFNILTPQTITALYLFRASAAGNAVRIYDSTTSTIAETSITSSQPTVIDGTETYNEQAIAPLLLTPGLYYIVADVRGGTFMLNYNAVGLTSNTPGVSFGSAVSSTGFGNPTTSPFAVNSSTSYLLVNFEVASTTVPEPASLALLGLALAGVVVHRRRLPR